MLVDWLSFDLPYEGGRCFKQEFEKPWDSDIVVPKRISGHTLEGSWSSKVRVLATGTRLEFDGNPVRFFTGQNIIGTFDVQELILLTYEALLVALDLPSCDLAVRAIRDGNVRIRRIDLTDHWHVGTDDDVRSFLEVMGDRASFKNRGPGTFHSAFCTVAWGLGGVDKEGNKTKGSRRSSLKFYNKYQEVAKHKMTCPDTMAKLLRNWSCGKVRVEACYRGQELDTLGMRYSREWDEHAPRAMLDRMLERLELPDQVVLMDEKLDDVERPARMAYELWKSGTDVRALMSNSSFYRARKEIMVKLNVDIKNPRRDSAPKGRTIKLIEVLKAEPVECPHQGLFESLALDGFERLREEALRRAAA